MKQPQYKIIIELRISSITAGVLETKDGENYNLIRVEKRIVVLPEKLSLKEIFRKIKKPLFELMEELLKSFRSSDVLLGLNLPFYNAETRVIKIKRKNPFIIDKKFLGNLLKEEINIFKGEIAHRQELQEQGFELMEKEIMYVLLNGYPVKQILEKKVSEAELFLYLSIGWKSILDEIREEFERSRPNLKISFHSFPFIIYRTLNSILRKEGNFLVFKLGEEISEILLIEEGHIKEIVSFSKGVNFFARRISSMFGVSLEEGGNFLNNYFQEKLNVEYNQKIKEVVGLSSKEFEKNLKEAILLLSKEYFFPSKVLISAPSLFFPKIKEVFSQETFKNYTILRKPFELELLELKDLEPFLSIEAFSRAKIQNNLELALLSLFSIHQK